MIRQRKPLLINLALFVGSFIVVTYLFQQKLSSLFFTYIARIYAPMAGDFWVSLIVILLLSFYTAAFLSMVIFRSVNRFVAYSFYLLYFSTLIYFLFFKSIGIRGFSFNPFSFVSDFINNTGKIEALFNIIYFVPLGFLLGKKYLFFLLAITAIEIIQYTFSLGFFDLGDIILNFAGFYLGSFFYNFSIRIRLFSKSN